jgi:exodeoxyribonuclease-3
VPKGFVDIIKRENPDIIGLQETKLQIEQIPSEIEELSDYHKYWSCAVKKGYSGTCVMSKVKPLKVEYGFGKEEMDSEGRINIVEYETFILFNIYFPNGQRDDDRLAYKLRFYEHCLEVMQAKRRTGKAILVTGDYNTAHKPIDLTHPKANEKTSGFLPIERAWIDKIIDLGWVDTFRKHNTEPGQYSWWSYLGRARDKNVGWRIDYFFVDAEHADLVTHAGIRQDIYGSDHCPVTVEFTLQ